MGYFYKITSGNNESLFITSDAQVTYIPGEFTHRIGENGPLAAFRSYADVLQFLVDNFLQAYHREYRIWTCEIQPSEKSSLWAWYQAGSGKVVKSHHTTGFPSGTLFCDAIKLVEYIGGYTYMTKRGLIKELRNWERDLAIGKF